MRPIATVSVLHPLPPALGRLHELAHNLLWTWEPRIRECLRAVDPERWHGSNHNPTELFSGLDPERLGHLASSDEFLGLYNRALETLDTYCNGSGWYREQRPEQIEPERYAYFSAEFGLHESVPLYSGGLGVLAGDHIKAASDLELPLVAVCLFYQMGYFHQRLTVDGRQLESYRINDPIELQLEEVTNREGQPVTITLDMPRGTVVARLWQRTVGRVPLVLIDTNVADNAVPEYRDIADYLYGGDQETRIMQEIVLGIGGMRALRAMGIEPTVVHCNEGHSAFLLLERIRMTMSEGGMSFEEAAELVAAGAVFTTHTPVPAGNDAFPPALVETYFRDYWPQLGLSREQFLGLGRVNPANQEELFSMTVLALRLTSGRNGVSALHAEVSRSMWKEMWRGLPVSDVPITGVTNGVHTETWIADPMRSLFERCVGADWNRHLVAGTSDGSFTDGIGTLPDADLWETKCSLREALINDVHRRLEDRQDDWYLRSRQGRALDTILDPNALTIGFARRFATYKRATLLFRDPERALRLFTDPERPLQLLLAGKAHPRDAEGKKFVQAVIGFIREHNLEGRIIFVEDYDMAVARRLVQGCDVWLNTPRRPMEASGTSGMKAAINGALNLSVLDGWFPEAWDGTNGFTIGGGEEFNSEDIQDEHDSRALYRVLEEEVIPAFFDRDEAGVPNRWVAMMKRSIATITPQYSSNRMVAEYARRFYFPASDRFRRLRAEGGGRTRALVAWRRRVRERWDAVRVTAAAEVGTTMDAGQSVSLHAQVELGSLSPNDVQVQAYYGTLDSEGMIANGRSAQLVLSEVNGSVASYTGTATLNHPGRVGITVRVLPSHPDLADPLATGLIRWARS